MISGCNRFQGSFSVSLLLFLNSELPARCRVPLRVASASHIFPACHHQRLAPRGTVKLRVFVRRRVWPVAATCLATGVWARLTAPCHVPHRHYPDLGAPQYLRATAVAGTATAFHCELVFVIHPPVVASIIPNSMRSSQLEGVCWMCLGRVLSLSRTLGENFLKSLTRPNLKLKGAKSHTPTPNP